MYNIHIYIYKLTIYKCDIFIDLIIRHTSISYVLYLYTHIYTWLCNIICIYIYTNAYYRTCMSHPNNQLSLTVGFWSHSGWAPRTWIFFWWFQVILYHQMIFFKKIRLERLINIFLSVSVHRFQTRLFFPIHLILTTSGENMGEALRCPTLIDIMRFFLISPG